MNRLFGTLPIAVALVFSPASMAQDTESHPSVARYFNAALEYWKLWETMDSELVNIVEEEGHASLVQVGSPASDALIKLQPDIHALIRASQMPICDWQIDYSAGFDTVLPHLGRIRMSASLLRADARRLIGEGDIEGATIRAIAALNVALHVSENNFLVGSLVGMAVGNLSCIVTNEILDSGKSTQADRDMLLAAFDQIDSVDRFGIKGAIALERDSALEWLGSEFAGEGSRDVSELFEYVSGGDAIGKDNPFEKFTDEDLMEDLDKLGTAYDALLSAWDADDVLDRMDAINESVLAGEYGELAKVLLPAFNNVRKAASRTDATIASTRERLVKTTDQVPDSTENPAPDSDG